MAIPAPVAKEHEVLPLLLCTYLMTFFSGMVDGTTFISSVTNVLPTHLTGTSVKIGIYFAENMIQELGGPMLGMLVSFFAGSLAAGVASRSKESKSLLTLSWCLLGIGALLGVTAVMLMADLEEAKYVAAFASGLQNGVLTVTTGFARTTHVTGTVTDVGLLVGQGVNPATWTNESHWWKARTLSYLVVLFIAGGATALLLFENAGLEEATMIIPAAGAFVLGLLWQVHCRRELAKVDAGDPATDSEPKSLGAGVVHAVGAGAQLVGQASLKAGKAMTSSMTSSMTKMLLALASEVPTIDSMPDKPSFKSKAKSSMHANSAVNVMKNMSKRKKAASTPVAHAEIVSLCKLLATDPNMVQAVRALDPLLLEKVEVIAEETLDEQADPDDNAALKAAGSWKKKQAPEGVSQ